MHKIGAVKRLLNWSRATAERHAVTDRTINWERRPNNQRSGSAVFSLFHGLRESRKRFGIAPEGVDTSDHQRRISVLLHPLLCDILAAAVADEKSWLLVGDDDPAEMEQLLRILSASESHLITARHGTSGQGSRFAAIQASNSLLQWISDHGLTSDDFAVVHPQVHTYSADLRKSNPINLHLKLDRRWLGLITELVDETATHFSIDDERPSSRLQRVNAMNVIVANLANCRSQGADQFLAISRTEGTYTKGRYSKNSFGYDNFVRCIDYLRDRKEGAYLKYHIGFNDRIRGKSFNTRIMMTDLLFTRICNYAPSVDNYTVHNDNEEKRLNHTGTNLISLPISFPITRRVSQLLLSGLTEEHSETLILKDEDKNYIDYVDTIESTAMRRRNEAWNTFVDENWIDLFLPDKEFAGLYRGDGTNDVQLWEREDSYDPHYIDLSRRHLYRVFNNRSWDQGGRFYGGWWQSVPKSSRPYITINWHPTREVDYSGLHINMLYHLRGKAPPDDPYAIEGIPSEYRPLIKETLLTIINAGKDQRVARPEPDELPPKMDWPAFVDAIRTAHEAIADDFTSGSGIRLQRVDSDIAESVMLTLMNKDILVLPVHDSFLVRRGYDGALREAMASAYRDKINADIGFKGKLSFRDLEAPDKISSSFKEFDSLIDEDSPIDGYESYFDRKNYVQSRFRVEKSRRFEY